jgi:hypothetical protein
MDSERLGRLQRAMQLFVDQGEIPNAEVVVARHGKVCYCARAGYLDVASGRPLPEDALFRMSPRSSYPTRGATAPGSRRPPDSQPSAPRTQACTP